MSERLILQDLVDQLAKENNLTKKDAEAFFRELLSLIAETIETADSVKIKDFGTFKVVKVNSRKSVDVNTGAEIEIPAHYKLTFSPDKALKEKVNAPFAHFESVVLEEGVSFGETQETYGIESVNEDGESDDSFDEETDTIASYENDSVAKGIIKSGLLNSLPDKQPDNKEEDLIEVASDVSVTNQEQPAELPSDENTIIASEEEQVNEDLTREEILAGSDVSNIQDSELSAVEVGIGVSEKVESEHVELEDRPENEPVESVVIPDDNDKEDTIEQASLPTAESKEQEEDVKQDVVEQPEDSDETEEDEDFWYEEDRANKKKVIIGIVAVAVIVLIIFGWRYKSVIMPDRKSVAVIVQEPDTIAVADTFNTVNVTAANDSLKTDENKEVKGESKKITIGRGDTMRELGLKYYGLKSFWVYIYEENKDIITNPNNVPLGANIVIPPAEKYGINKFDPESVEKAKRLENQLYAEFAN